ncbi:hypothetical protein [Parazoarcus communis]|uniref:hypothetical protein n=1 Tax=Parazoarcus communis TaxID=41977 RepID=UPI001900E573|nr:hypothetical protein [Parazoarcus communis]
MKMSIRRMLSGFVFSALLVAVNTASAQGSGCGPITSRPSFGPFDYRTATPVQLRTVEGFHFTPDVEMMRRGKSTSVLAADIAYTLRHFPNHHRALKTMGDWSLKVKRNPPPGGEVTVECWFERAARFAPDDAMVKTIHGLYLLKRNQPKEAVEQLELALAQAGEDANVHYNLGLAYADLKQYDKALSSAHAAYRLGFPLPGLKNKLERVGAWREP